MRTVGISALIEDTGEKARAIQHWSDIGILRAESDTDRKGRGRYREYAAEPHFGERKWALVASALNELRIPLGEIRSIVDNMRTFGGPNFAEAGASEQAAINKFRVSFFYKALVGQGDVLVLIGQSMIDGRACIDHLFLPAIGEETLSPPPNTIGERPAEFTLGMIVNFMREHESAYCLNLTKIFAPLRK